MYLPGVGPNRKKMLSNELGIETYGDLLEYYPYKYVDRSKVYTIHELTGDMPYVQVVGHILSFDTYAMGPRKERVVAHFTDGTAICDLTWFNGGKYAKQTYRIGTEYVVFGKPTVFNNRINFTHPDLDEGDGVAVTLHDRGIVGEAVVVGLAVGCLEQLDVEGLGRLNKAVVVTRNSP